MSVTADILLIAAAIGAALFCMVLARRLQSLARLDDGLGAAISVLSAEVDTLNRALVEARDSAGSSARALEAGTARADQAARRLELLLAALSDIETPPQTTPVPQAPNAPTPPRTDGAADPARTRVIRRHFAGVEL